MTKIIVIEGIDGTGKTVQLTNLHHRLEARGYRVMSIGFPVYESFFGSQVGRYLTNKDGISASDVDAKSMALWFAMDRFAAFQNLDYAWADVLLINRYVLSNAVYQSIREQDLDKPDLLDFVLELEHGQLKLPRPDGYIVLDMNLEAASENVVKKGFREYVGASQKDVYESTDGIQERARKKYQEYAKRLDTISILNCMGVSGLKSIDEIGSLIDAVVDHILEEKKDA